MNLEFLYLMVMLSVFLLAHLLLRQPVSLSMVLGAVAASLVSGHGIPLRHLFEGTFTYIDTILIISTAMLFMTAIQESGALAAMNAAIVTRFHKYPAIMLILLMFTIMFPGMITGSSTAAVLTAGAIVAPVLTMIGIPKAKAGAIIAIGAIMGMAAPPVNIPAMLIAGGVDMPYIGFEGPLLLISVVCAVFTVLFLGLKHCKKLDLQALQAQLDLEAGRKYGLKLYLPIVLLALLLVMSNAFPAWFPQLSTPLIFLICAGAATLTGRRFPVWEKSLSAMDTTIPVLGKLMGVGMFIQVLTLTGARGWIVVSCLSLPQVLLYAAIAIIMPAFGAISSYGAASVMGVPFLLALLYTGDQITIAALLAFICCLGDLMPPTALAGNYSAQIVGLPYRPVLRQCAIPFLVCITLALIYLQFTGALAFLTP